MNHLNDEQAAAFLIGDEGSVSGVSCAECMANVNDVRRQIGTAREDMAAAAERDEIFWARQRAAIRQRIAPTRTTIRLQWAASLAALVAVATLLIGTAGKPEQEAVQASQPDPDYILLAEIQQTLARPLPNAVEPVRVLASDMDQAWRAHIQKAQSSKLRSTGR